MHKYSTAELSESKKKALRQICEILDKGNPDEQFKDRSGGYHSNDKFIVTFKGNLNGIACEMQISKCDSFYSAYSGAKAVYCATTLLQEKQIDSYQSIWRALIDVGLKICPAKEKVIFYDKYVPKYNEYIENLKKEQEK